jgi:hypothetical protein
MASYRIPTQRPFSPNYGYVPPGNIAPGYVTSPRRVGSPPVQEVFTSIQPVQQGFVTSPRRVGSPPVQEVFTSIQPARPGYVTSPRRIYDHRRYPHQHPVPYPVPAPAPVPYPVPGSGYISGVPTPMTTPQAVVDTEVLNLLETHPEGLVYDAIHDRVNRFLNTNYGWNIRYTDLADIILASLTKFGQIVERGRYPRIQVWVRRNDWRGY